MARTYSAAEANRNFSKILREVAAGERVIVTSRGKPVAEIGPSTENHDTEAGQEKQRDFERFLDELRARPVMNLPRATRDEMYE
jgi:prevent-host-death family protein